jgi:hypothetical protein
VARTTPSIALWMDQVGWLPHDHKAMQTTYGQTISKDAKNSEKTEWLVR